MSKKFKESSCSPQRQGSKISKQSMLVIVVLIFCFMINGMVESKENNILVVKNNKIAQISFTNNLSNIQQQQQKTQSAIKIINNQQIFKVQIPVKNLSSNQETLKFLQSHLPNLSVLLTNKGYIKPLVSQGLESQQKQFLKGFVYTKAAVYHQSAGSKQEQINDQISGLLKTLIKQNDLASFNMRLEDTFEIQFIVDNQNKTKVIYIEIKYLFPTLDHTTIPQTLLSTLTIKQYQQQISTNKKQILERRVSGKGLHQFINFTLLLDDKTDIQLQTVKENCWLQFTDILPQTTYVDVDQRRKQIQNYQVINIQKPAFDSKQYFYKYTVTLKEFKEVGVNKYLYQQPIHFRYPEPSLLNYTKVYLHPIEEARIICRQTSQANNQIGEKAYPVQENKLFDRGTAKIPNADISKQKIVSIVTLAVCLVTVLMITSKLKQF